MPNPVSKRKHLRLYTEQPPKPVSDAEESASLSQVAQSFQSATGWALRRIPNRAKQAKRQPTELCLAPLPDAETPAIDRGVAEGLANSIAQLFDELKLTRNALRQREAELAAGVPMVPHRDEDKHLAERLQATLMAGAEALGCQAAALYLLDDATTHLKLRSSCGLPFDRMTAPARPLQGAIADLEAMLGHAVVLGDELIEAWHAPEKYPAAVCVPVSTPTTLLGTLWVFCEERRDFNDRETNVLEVVAGRLASDLEREMLLRSAVDGANLKKQLSAVERLQRNELPAIPPIFDGLDLAGCTTSADGVGSTFHDWFCLADGVVALAVGRAAEQGMAGALNSGMLKTALRCHAQYQRNPDRVLQQINTTLWTGSAGDRFSELFLGLFETATGRMRFSSAGRASVALLQAEGWQLLGRNATRLGKSPEAEYRQFTCQLQSGEALILAASADNNDDARDRAIHEADLARLLQGKLDLSAEELVAAARAEYERRGFADCSILVVKSSTP